jgi:hypothetical protein
LILVLATTVLHACGGGEPSADETRDLAPASDSGRTDARDAWLLAPGGGAIGLGPGTTHDSLLRSLGKEFVVVARLESGLGDSVSGTVLFPEDSTRRLEILWRDTAAQAHPLLLRVRGTESRWRLFPGVSLGDSRRAVQQHGREVLVLVRFADDRAVAFEVPVDAPPPRPAPPPAQVVPADSAPGAAPDSTSDSTVPMALD